MPDPLRINAPLRRIVPGLLQSPSSARVGRIDSSPEVCASMQI
nr:MAG TPA: hypothetical protein [Caudoviricetes sp.]